MIKEVPAYLQIRNVVVEKIQNGTYSAGDKIPSEWELVKKFNVSRMTARRAITGLVSQGFAEVKPGKGTFVTNKIIKKIFLLSVVFPQTCSIMALIKFSLKFSILPLKKLIR